MIGMLEQFNESLLTLPLRTVAKRKALEPAACTVAGLLAANLINWRIGA